MKIRTSIKAGQTWPPGPTVTNHNQTVAQVLKVKTNVKAGGVIMEG